MNTPTSFGLWLRQRRRALDLTQEGLAQCVGCSLSAIRKIEADERRPSRQVAELLATCLRISAEDCPLFLKVARAELRVERLAETAPLTSSPDRLVPYQTEPLEPIPLQLARRSSASLPNLLTRSMPFLGRERELVAIAQLLQNPDCHLLTLVGAGGIGKTRLALEVASKHHGTFADGVHFVPLAPVSASEFIVPTIADAIGFAFFGPVEPQTQLLNYLREKQALLVLDNLEHLLPASEGSEEGVGALAEILHMRRE
jgi:transcriptional regulator with XRE-family HTH domain